ncbi:hypothetical protein ABNF97_10170 [Plantactinospora sp. B6F1]|uniref:hypothetical protein n=1 Tax=Plantactinospora sp. B6F1 TaxID=3158971 RepID=UPI0032D94218
MISLVAVLLLTTGVLVVAVLRPQALLATKAALPSEAAPAGPAPATATDPGIEYEFDVFLSSPMSSLDEANYTAHRDGLLKLVRKIEERCNYRCYYAGRNRPTASEFEAEDVALRNDLRALRRSRFFLMVVPEQRVSSVWVEAGIALAMSKSSVYLGRTDVELPFVLRGAARSTHPEIPRIRMYSYRDIDEAIKLIEVNGRSLFDHTT